METHVWLKRIFSFIFAMRRDVGIISSVGWGETIYEQSSVCGPTRGWSGGAKILGKLPLPGRPTIWMIVG